jgi:hypothetical protein
VLEVHFHRARQPALGSSHSVWTNSLEIAPHKPTMPRLGWSLLALLFSAKGPINRSLETILYPAPVLLFVRLSDTKSTSVTQQSLSLSGAARTSSGVALRTTAQDSDYCAILLRQQTHKAQNESRPPKSPVMRGQRGHEHVPLSGDRLPPPHLIPPPRII